MTTKDYFELNKNVDKFYVASDGQHFVNKGDADNHGRTLKKLGTGSEKVTSITRAEALAIEALPADQEKKEEPVVELTPLQLADKLVKDTASALDAAKGGVEAAKLAMQAAVDAKGALANDATATGPQKTAASKLVTKTTQAVADAEAVLSNAALDNKDAIDALEALQNPNN